MKITFIIATLNSGGAERVLVTLANEFCKEHEVKIIKFHSGDSFYPLDEKIKVKTLQQFRFDNIYHKIASRFKKYFALRKALKEEKSDIFISFLDTTNIACIVAKIGIKTPLIICEHSNEAYLKSKIWRFLRRITYPFCDALSVLGNKDKEFYEKFVKKVIVLANPTHFKLQNESFEKENFVLFVGRLDYNKNALMYLKAIANLDENLRKNYNFLILGDGELKQELEYKAKSLNIKVEFLGRIKDVKTYYSKAKILCLCSFMEGLPTVLIEALYFDVARIATRYYNGASDLIDDAKDGFLINCDDELALAEKMTLLMQDESLRKKLVLDARKRCKDYDILQIKEKWMKIINELRIS